ncbi:MAG TPA: UDP-N-acetylmuramate dehydrogenase [Candidatus Limiplasma sp.]|nr:UDP-N-acetylmuramate dehydrogenase [Candidatus Limiplasma sp.]
MEDAAKAELISALRLAVPKGDILENVPMSRYTTLKIGGPAELLVEISDDAQAVQVLKIAARHGVPVQVIGNGSNVLVKDGGLKGLTLHFGERFSDISSPASQDGKTYLITAQAGAAMTALANAAADAGLTGLEFAAGIPGTVGGGVRMNAGAYGGEIGDMVVSAACVTLAGEMKIYSHDEMEFGYRRSRLTDEILLFVTVMLRRGDAETVRVAMREFNARRREKQPLTVPCCGSTFKRPPGRFAGELIESCGLKGCRIGGVSVSEKHANFLVNDRQGTAADYIQLIHHVQQVVKEQTGIDLEPEVKILGED